MPHVATIVADSACPHRVQHAACLASSTPRASPPVTGVPESPAIAVSRTRRTLVFINSLQHLLHRPGVSSSNVSCQKPVSYTHLRAHETRHDLVCRLLLEKKKK